MADLIRLLEEAPQVMNSKDANAKSAHAHKVFSALERLSEKQMTDTIESLEPDTGDILLKYVYRGLEVASDNNAALFKWQAKLTDKFGIGSIVRVLTDRKTV